jgi:translation initiation factor 2 subunit 3
LTDSKLLKQPEVNIGTAGHVDHGKTSLLEQLSGTWASKHSEELRRGITIRLGYADTAVYKCPNCPPPTCYTIHAKCPNCGAETVFLRALSFVDCPGHEVLMTTTLSGAAVMDGAILVIAANEPVPQPQTREHIAALDIIGVKNIVVVQNKVDLVSREMAVENYRAIKEFLKKTSIGDVPVIPTSAQHGLNIDLLLEAIEKYIPTPKRDPTKPPFMHIVRSFDINKPRTDVENIVGGVIGGTVTEGKLELGDEIEIKPGIRKERSGRPSYQCLRTNIVSLFASGKNTKQVGCGGLVGIGTTLDPSLTKADGLIGNVVGKEGQLPEVKNMLNIETTLFDYVIGTMEPTKVEPIKQSETLVINAGTSVSVGLVTASKKSTFQINLKKPVCYKTGSRVALSRKILGKWRLIGWGVLKD